jgi:hypothetical protein
MKFIGSYYNNLLCVVIFLVLTASSLQGADNTQTKQTDPLSFERVKLYLCERDHATTLQKNKTEKDLLGRVYRGILYAWDVTEDGNDIIIFGSYSGETKTLGNCDFNYALHFRVQDATLKKKASQIRKNDDILVTASLDKFWVKDSGYINVPNIKIAEFKNVQELEVQPKNPVVALAQKSSSASLKHYADDQTGLSFDYPNVADWAIRRPPEVNPPARVTFTNSKNKATLVVGFLQLPNVIPELSEPGILQAAVDNIFGSYQKKNPQARLVSSRIVTNAQNGVKGVEVVYADSVGGERWKGRLVAFFKGSKRYDVTAFALENEFERADTDFFSVILQTFKF